MNKKLLNRAIQISKNKVDKYIDENNFLHFTFIVQSNKIIGYAPNKTFSPPIHFGYNNRLGLKGDKETYRPKLHSEIFAFKKVRGILKGEFEIINIRLNKNKELRMSKPCSCCYMLLKEFSCKHFYYSTNDNSFLKI